MPDQKPYWRKALWITLALRVIYSLFAAGAALIQAVNWQLIHSNALTENLATPNRSLSYLFFGVWERFDTLWYLHIAAHGYDLPASVVFFPLYPVLIRVGSFILSRIVAALLISSISFFFLLLGLHELLSADMGAQLAEDSILLMAIWPASFIFFAGYAESLLLAFIVWSLVMARSGRWASAAVLGVAAALTKAVGVVVIVPLLVMAIRRKQVAWQVLFVPSGLAAFMGWLRWTGHGSITSAYAQYWRTTTAPFWSTLGTAVTTFFHAPNVLLAVNFVFLFIMCALVIASKMRLEYLLYAAAAILICLTKQTDPPLQSTLRYLLIVFPAPVGLARILQASKLHSTFALVCATLFAVDLALLWLFLGWSLVL